MAILSIGHSGHTLSGQRGVAAIHTLALGGGVVPSAIPSLPDMPAREKEMNRDNQNSEDNALGLGT